MTVLNRLTLVAALLTAAGLSCRSRGELVVPADAATAAESARPVGQLRGDAATGAPNAASRDAGASPRAQARTEAGGAHEDPGPDAGAPSGESIGTRFPEPIRAFTASGNERLKGSNTAIACAGRKPCRLVESAPAWTDEKGQSHEVFTVSLWSQKQSEKHSDEEGSAAAPGECEPFEDWLVTRDQKGARSAELLLERCNDGYGAAGVGEEHTEIAGNRFQHARSGGSNWRWFESTVESLSPRRILQIERSGNWVLGPNVSHYRWSWEVFAGWEVVYSPPCWPDGGVPEVEEVSPLENAAPIEEAGYAEYTLPVVTLDRGFAKGGWRTTGLGGCSLEVDGTAGHGFLIHGQHGGPSDSSMKVVGASDGAFYLEIKDDHFVGPTKNWLYDDHVEIWVAETAPLDYYAHCDAPRREKPRQWAVRIADGRVFSGYGHPAPEGLKTERGQPGGDAKRLKIVPPTGRITFVYSDGDDGASQHALLATSHLVFGDALSLGHGTRVSERDAVCGVKEGELTPVLR